MDSKDLGEVLAEFETRLLFLEGSLPYSRKEEVKTVYQDMQWTPRQMDMVQQLKAQVLYLEHKLNEHIDRKKGQSPKNILLTNNKNV